MAILLNGLVKDYNPPGGIDAAGTLQFDPTAQAWAAAATVACPQGDGGGITVTKVATSSGGLGAVPFDGGFSPRSGLGDDGFYKTVASSVGGKFFSTNIRCNGSTGTVEPTVSGLDNQIFWSLPADFGWVWRGARANSTAYAVGDLMSSNGAIWRCVIAGTSDVAPPAGLGTALYKGTVSDGGIFWFKQFRAAGAWAASTVVAGATVQDTNTHVVADALTTTGGALLIFNGIPVTNGTTAGAEPAWTAATAGQKYWADNNVIWIQGKDLFGRSGALQAERIVLTGFVAAASNGKTVTVENIGTGAMDVVLADKNALNNQGVNELTGTDMASVHGFDVSGSATDRRLGPGESCTAIYSTATGLWTVSAPPPSVALGRDQTLPILISTHVIT